MEFSLQRKPWLKRVFVSFAVLCFIATPMIGVFNLPYSPAHAASAPYGFAPNRYMSGYTYGNGVYFAPYRFKVYTTPAKDAPLVGEFRWTHDTQTNSIPLWKNDQEVGSKSADQTFICFYPQLDVAMLAVTGDTEDGWIEVVYDQTNHKTGWIPLNQANTQTLPSSSSSTSASTPVHFGVYQTWLEFMKLNAKASGVAWLSGVSQYHRSLHSSDADDAKLIPVTIIRDLKVRHVRGNWLLVEVLDFERNTPIGWIRWRDDNGNLMVFPNISRQNLPVVLTAY